MTHFVATIDTLDLDEPVEATSWEGQATCVLSNPAAENGYDQNPGPLTWLNSARMSTNLEEDSVSFRVSIGDPRGGFVFTIRRLPDGRIVIHTPHPGESFAHMPTKQHHTGTLMVVHQDGETPHDFSDPEPEWVDAASSLPRERVVTLLEKIGFACYDDDGTGELRETLIEAVRDGNIDECDLCD